MSEGEERKVEERVEEKRREERREEARSEVRGRGEGDERRIERKKWKEYLTAGWKDIRFSFVSLLTFLSSSPSTSCRLISLIT